MTVFMSMSNRSVVHMDLDTFFVSVERLRDSRLNNKPVIIGGLSDRGVVASCSYEARKYGVRSAMPIRMARKLCPDGVYMRGDMDAYSSYSKTVTDIIAEKVPVYEKASVDEFYMDLSGMDRFFGCYKYALELRNTIRKETGLPLSLGLSANKTVSKIATGEAKPNGHREVSSGTEKSFLAPLPVRKIPGVGEETAKTLLSLGIQRIETLQEMPKDLLISVFGKHGFDLWNKANGLDENPVIPYSEEKSISHETTFEQDSIDLKMMQHTLIHMAEKLCSKLRGQEKLASVLTIKIRYADFETHTKQMRIPYSASDHHIIRYAREIFQKVYDRRMRIRLIGLKLSGLVHGSPQLTLFDDSPKLLNLYATLDKLNHRYGDASVHRAVTPEMRRKT